MGAGDEQERSLGIIGNGQTKGSHPMAEYNSNPPKLLNLKAGDWVEVRSPQEILATLDEKGCLENMPFMPEMFAFCGQRFRVYKRAHKTCDTVFPVRGRRVNAAVHLETRCDGRAHGGCQAGCLIFWKEAWLKRTSCDSPSDDSSRVEADSGNITAASTAECMES